MWPFIKTQCNAVTCATVEPDAEPVKTEPPKERERSVFDIIVQAINDYSRIYLDYPGEIYLREDLHSRFCDECHRYRMINDSTVYGVEIKRGRKMGYTEMDLRHKHGVDPTARRETFTVRYCYCT
jgi:hypothetical protein